MVGRAHDTEESQLCKRMMSEDCTSEGMEESMDEGVAMMEEGPEDSTIADEKGEKGKEDDDPEEEEFIIRVPGKLVMPPCIGESGTLQIIYSCSLKWEKDYVTACLV